MTDNPGTPGQPIRPKPPSPPTPPNPPSPSSPPVGPGTPQAPVVEGDATHGVIPYKNPHALSAYYTAVLGFWCPGIGLVALFLGLKGLKAYKKNPVISGVAHSWVGIIVGGGATLLWLTCGVLTAISLIAAATGNP